jgi:hypothetical protein
MVAILAHVWPLPSVLPGAITGCTVGDTVQSAVLIVVRMVWAPAPMDSKASEVGLVDTGVVIDHEEMAF